MERGIKDFLSHRQKTNLFRTLRPVSILAGGRLRIEGREYVNFSSNDYLGLAAHPEIIEASHGAASSPFGSSASRLMSGSTHLHHALEERVASFKGKEAALVFNSGYQANVGIVSALCSGKDCVFSDRLNHASIVDGIRLSGARFLRFRHNDAVHLERLLRRHRAAFSRALIVTETVFSMDGDIAPIREMTRLRDRYDCMLMVDEAHATGIFGHRGSGLVEQEEVTGKVDIIMGTFSKALGSFGAYAACSGLMRDYLVNTCRSFIYSTALPQGVIAANLKAIELVEKEPRRRLELLRMSTYLRERLLEKGLNTRGASQIIPVMTKTDEKAVVLSERLRKRGWWVTPVRPPTVPRGEARIRLSLTFDHKKDVVESLLGDIEDLWINVSS